MASSSMLLLLLLGLLLRRVQSAATLPTIPLVGEKASELEYVFWAVIAYFFLLQFYLSFKFVFPMIEIFRQLTRDQTDTDPRDVDPEKRGSVLKESMWVIFTNAVLSVFHVVVIILCNTFQESSLGVATMIGTETLNNMLQLGVILLFAKMPIYVNSWVTVRDGFIVSISTILFIANILQEESDVIAIGFVILLMIYWVAEVMSPRISKKLNEILSKNKGAKFEQVEKLALKRRSKIDLKVLKEFMPVRTGLNLDLDNSHKLKKSLVKDKNEDRPMTEEEKKAADGLRNMKKWDARFNMMYMNTKSTAKKMRILIKKALFLHIASVIIAIQKMKFAKKEQMKKERLSAYRVDQFGIKKEDRIEFGSFYKPEDAENSMLEVKDDDADKLDPYGLDPVEQPKNRAASKMSVISKDIASALSKSVASFPAFLNDEDKPIMQEVVIHKGKVFYFMRKLGRGLFWVLLPFSFLVDLAMPNLSKPRAQGSKAFLIYGFVAAVVLSAAFSFVIVWFEDALFRAKRYPVPLMGWLINSGMITLPHLLYSLSIIAPKQRLINFFAQFQQLTVYRFCFVLAFCKIFDVAFKTRYDIFKAGAKEFTFGLLIFLGYEVLLCLLVFLMNWTLPQQAGWLLVSVTFVSYGVMIGMYYAP